MTKEVSVIIPTYNGKNKIKNVLSSLEKQTFQDFEVIVVVDGSIDGTYDYLMSQDWKLSNLKIIQQTNKGRSGARNKGASIAKGDYLIFFDDDVTVHQNIIREYIGLFKKGDHDTIVGVLKPVFTDRNSSFQQYCNYLNTKWGTELEKGELKHPYITANNFGMSRRLFDEVGGFDERLTDVEDFDLAVRIFELGHPIFLDDQLVVYHKLQDSFSQYITRQLEYKHASEKLLAISPTVRKYKSRSHYSKLKKLFLLLFSSSLFIEGIDKNKFKFMPANLRFKLYDWILEANLLYKENG